MRTIFLILFLLTIEFSFSQDTTVTWLNNIDTSSFQIFYKKKNIPVYFYSIIGIKNKKDIASSNKSYQTGCVGRHGLPRKRLNWLAQDNNNHWVLSVSYGGFAHGTKYFFINKDNGKLNVNCFHFFGTPNYNDLTFGATIYRLKARQFRRVLVNQNIAGEDK